MMATKAGVIRLLPLKIPSLPVAATTVSSATASVTGLREPGDVTLTSPGPLLPGRPFVLSAGTPQACGEFRQRAARAGGRIPGCRRI